MELINSLEVLGLKKNTAMAYIALLKLHKANPYNIAKEAGLERTTIYRIMEELAKKGLVNKVVDGKKFSYSAESPAKLKELLTNQEYILSEALPLLLSIQGSKGKRPTVKYFDDISGMRKVLLDSLNSKEKLRRDFSSVGTIVETLGKRFIQNQIEQRVKKGIKVLSLRCKNKDEEIKNDWYLKGGNTDILREVRYLNSTLQFEPTFFIYAHKVAVISSKNESYALVVESAEFANAMKILFDIAWISAA